MNGMTITPADTTTATVGFGIVVTTPDGQRVYEPCRDLLAAIYDADRINRAFPGTAAVVYRNEEYGPWGETGNVFGTRYEWEDGRFEYEPAESRAEADLRTRGRLYGNQPGATAARTVSRHVMFGEWQPFTTAVPDLPAWLDTPAPQPTGFLAAGMEPPRRWTWRDFFHR
ncbi:hypothetical protein ABZ671_01030 [Micromonospora sp. NPDC006766]|uniref:hypothetical protein n=1 Tax=Micromonospora sp. NPDC006766 TaxID=3154778 RepID=UPI0033E21FA7